MENWNIDKYLDLLTKAVVEYTPKVITALIILAVGLWLIRLASKLFRKLMIKQDIDITLQKFLNNLVNWTLKILLFVIVISNLGVQTTSFVAIIGAAGLAIGLALQGSLANFAGGVLIMLFKPFKVGDFINAKGISGTVKEIGIFTTNLNTFGNELAIIPNGQLSNDNIINYSAEATRRNNIVTGIGYSSDIRKAKEILLQIAKDYPKINDEPVPEVYVAALADSSVNLSLRYWSAAPDYWACNFHVLEQIKYEFDKAGIEIPYPHQVEIQK